MNQPALPRRRFVQTTIAGSLLASPALTQAQDPEPSQDSPREVRLEYLKPHQIEAAMNACPVLFQPLGTIEWHGLQNVVGVDALKAHHLCLQAAQQGGGLVAPPLYGGVGGLNEAHTFVIEPEDNIHSILLRSWLERLCGEAVRQGFKAVIILTGHYGAAQQIVVRETAVRMSQSLAVPVLGTPEYILALDEDYLGDHAAWGETSLMMHLEPDTVDLSLLGEEPHKGVFGRDPKRFASKDDGQRLAQTIIKRLAALAAQMPQWDRATLHRFIQAESALVDRQIQLAGEEGKPWAAWRHIGDGVLKDYAQCLVERRFEAIVDMAKTL